MTEGFLTLVRYAAGADAILFTYSAFGLALRPSLAGTNPYGTEAQRSDDGASQSAVR